jgi:hypothetical protein
MTNALKRRLAKLERGSGAGIPAIGVFTVRFVASDGEGGPEYLTSEEEAILTRHEEEEIAAATPPAIVQIHWTRENAQSLLAGGGLGGGLVE